MTGARAGPWMEPTETAASGCRLRGGISAHLPCSSFSFHPLDCRRKGRKRVEGAEAGLPSGKGGSCLQMRTGQGLAEVSGSHSVMQLPCVSLPSPNLWRFIPGQQNLHHGGLLLPEGSHCVPVSSDSHFPNVLGPLLHLCFQAGGYGGISCPEGGCSLSFWLILLFA